MSTLGNSENPPGHNAKQPAQTDPALSREYLQTSSNPNHSVIYPGHGSNAHSRNCMRVDRLSGSFQKHSAAAQKSSSSCTEMLHGFLQETKKNGKFGNLECHLDVNWIV